jgi:BirA family biotin operon repressor/biotin-[acetyl-CoA-carboxylase] ligase
VVRRFRQSSGGGTIAAVTVPTRAPLDAAAIDAALDPARDGNWHIEVVAETSSTNADLLHAVQAHAAGTPTPRSATGSVLVAEYQHGGRGRFDRVWGSPTSAGLTLSALVRPTAARASWGWLPLLAGVALRDALLAGTGDARVGGDPMPAGVGLVSLKWPNDILLGPAQKKVAGILVQSVADGVVIGIGLNVTTRADELPVPTATSLALEGWPTDRAAVLKSLLRRLHARYQTWNDADGSASRCGLLEEYRRHCSTIGRRVSIDTSRGLRHGAAVGVDETGRLEVRFDDSETIEAVSAGDVTHLRAAGN